MPVVGVAPALAKGTASVRPAGKAETATTAKSKVLVPWAQYKAGHRYKVDKPPPEVLLQKGEHNPEVLSYKCEPKHPKMLLPDGMHECGVTPQGNPIKAKCKPNQLPQELSHEAVLSTWEVPGP